MAHGVSFCQHPPVLRGPRTRDRDCESREENKPVYAIKKTIPFKHKNFCGLKEGRTSCTMETPPMTRTPDGHQQGAGGGARNASVALGDNVAAVRVFAPSGRQQRRPLEPIRQRHRGPHGSSQDSPARISTIHVVTSGPGPVRSTDRILGHETDLSTSSRETFCGPCYVATTLGVEVRGARHSLCGSPPQGNVVGGRPALSHVPGAVTREGQDSRGRRSCGA